MKRFTPFASATSDALPRGERDAQPLIGLSANIDEQTSRLHHAYVRSVEQAGGVPVISPATTDAGVLRRLVETLDGLILTGGADVGGEYFGEKTLEGLAEVDPGRDAYDFLLLKLAADRQLPIFGICRGMQVINIAFGGGLWQDIPTQYPGNPLDHKVLANKEKSAHDVEIAPDSLLSKFFSTRRIGVNSRHHQAVAAIAPGFSISASAPDGITEAIEAYPVRRIFGVQWHPENMAAEGNDKGMQALFEFFTAESALFKRAKSIHRRALVLDSHCDTPMLFGDHTIDIGRRSEVAKVDLPKMTEGLVDGAFVVAYLPQGPLDDASRRAATQKAEELLAEMQRQIDANEQYAGQARTMRDAAALKAENKKSIFLAIENGYALSKDPDNLERFQKMGVTYITLCHNGANDLCDSAAGEPLHGGLSPLGKTIVAKMNRLGIAVDISHAAPSTVADVLEISTKPIIATHASARARCDHPRNLSDDQLRAIAEKGGVIQSCLYAGFLAQDRPATILDAVAHIEHIIQIVGIDHVGIGSDFDGGGGIPGCDSANELINLTVELLRRGHSEQNLENILGGNLRRVLTEIQNV